MSRFSQYRVMWIFVFFDLPTYSRIERKCASDFRKNLLSDGFNMFQYSVYLRHCSSSENAAVHARRVKSLMPEYGQVTILTVTDKQYSLMQNFFGKKFTEQPSLFNQLEMF